MATFNVTYDIVTPESAEYGDCEESGFIDCNMTLRDAIDTLVSTRTNRVDGVTGVDTSESGRDFRWITVYNGMEYETGAQESRSLHIPDHITPASRARILRLVKRV